MSEEKTIQEQCYGTCWEACNQLDEAQTEIARLRAQLKTAEQYIAWIERLANSKKCWIVRSLAREALEKLNGAKLPNADTTNQQKEQP